MNALQRNARMLLARMSGAFAAAFYLGTCFLALCSAPESARAVDLPSPGDSVQVAAPAELPEAPGIAGRGAAPDLSPSPANTPEQLSGAFRNNGQGVSRPAAENGRDGVDKGSVGARRAKRGESSGRPNLIFRGALALGLSAVLLVIGALTVQLFGAFLIFPGILLFLVGLLVVAIGAARELALDYQQPVERKEDATLEEKKGRRRRFLRMLGLYLILISLPLLFVFGLGLLTLPVGLTLALAFPRKPAPIPEESPQPKAAPRSTAREAEAVIATGKFVRRLGGYIALGALAGGISFVVALGFTAPFAFPAYGLGLFTMPVVFFLALLLALIVWLVGAMISASAG